MLDDNIDGRIWLSVLASVKKSFLMKNKNLPSERNNSDRKMKVLTRYYSQYPGSDTEEKVSTYEENKDCVVVFDDMLVNKQETYFSLPHSC